jgi:hypothetical protein
MTQQYLLPCSCGQKMRVAAAQAGGQLKCGCGKSLSVPTLRGLRELELAPPETPARKRPGWSPVHGALFASGLLVAATGLALVTYSLWRYTQLASSGLSADRSGDVVKFESANIDKLTPLQMLNAWSELKEEGLGEKQTPIWVVAKEKIRGYQFWMTCGGGAFVAGVLLSVTALFVGRPDV